MEEFVFVMYCQSLWIMTNIITIILILTGFTNGQQTFNIYSSETSSPQCNAATSIDTCNLYCDTKDPSNTFSFDCGNTAICNFYCTNNKCFIDSSILNASNAHILNVYNQYEQCIQATVNLPNNGDAYFGISNSPQNPYVNTVINAGINTDEIYIDCTGAETGDDECNAMTINAQNANYLQINIGSDGMISNGNIYCPKNSNHSPVACKFDSSGGGDITNVNIYADNGYPDDVQFTVGGAFTSVNIICEASTGPITQSNVPSSFPTSGSCYSDVLNPPTSNPSTSLPTTSMPTTDVPTTGNPTIVKSIIVNPSSVWYIASEMQDYSSVKNNYYIECNNAYYCHVICDKINGCVNMIINGISTNLEIKCTQDYSCNNINLISSAANSTTLYCLGHKSCSFSNINLTKTINYISIICSSNINDFACIHNSYYLPFINNNIQTQININCFGVGCYYFGSIYIENNKLLNTQFYINGCDQCKNLNECIYNYSIVCNINHINNHTQTDSFINGHCKSRFCGCDEFDYITVHNNLSDDCMQNITYSTTNWMNNTLYSTTIQSNKVTVVIVITIAMCFMIIICICILFFAYSNKTKTKTKTKTVSAKTSQQTSISDEENSYTHNSNEQENNSKTLLYRRIQSGSTEMQIDKIDEQEITSIPMDIFAQNHDKKLHRKSKRKLLKTYSFEEVSKHCTDKSCWIIVDNLVLDVTKYLKYHTGGVESITKYGGTVCDEHFMFHSKTGKQLFYKFIIGKIHTQNVSNCSIQ